MNRIVRSITVGLLFLLLPSCAFAGNLTVKNTVKGCSSCEYSQAVLPECCRGTNAHTMGDVAGHETSTKNGDCSHSGFCRQEEGEGVAILSSAPIDTVFPAGSRGIANTYGIPAADISLDPFFLSQKRLTSIYILHCAFLI